MIDIPFSGQLVQQQYLEAQYLHQRPSSRRGGAQRLIFVTIAFMLLVVAVLNPSLLRLVLPIIFLVLVLVGFCWLYPRVVVATTWRHHTSLRAPMSGVVTTRGITYHGSSFRGEVDWSTFVKHKESPTLVLLYQSPLVFNLFPRSFFRTDNEWRMFLAQVQEHVPATLDGEARTRRIQWITFLGMMCIVGLISFVVSLLTALG
jgi:hypothetical protein